MVFSVSRYTPILSVLFFLDRDVVDAFVPTTTSLHVTLSTRTKLHGSVVDLTDDNFSTLLRHDDNANRLTLVDCYATWCGPCKLLEPIMDKVAASYDDEEQVLVCRYNIKGQDDDKKSSGNFKLELAMQGCMIRALPALLLLNAEGKVVEHWEGLCTEQFLHDGLRPHLQVLEPIVASPQKGLIAGRGKWQEEDSYMLSSALI